MNVNSAPIHFSANGIPRTAEPVTRGVPFPKGSLNRLDHLICKDPAGNVVPLQARGLERWGDGSWKWVLCDWKATVQDRATYHIEIGHSPNPQTYYWKPTEDKLFHPLRHEIPEYQLRMTGMDGVEFRYDMDPDTIVEEPGSLRLGTKRIGYFRRDGITAARVIGRLSFFADCPVIRVQVTLQNFQAASHPGGLWDLGDENSILFKSFSAHLKLKGTEPINGNYSVDSSSPAEPLHVPFELYQDSSGGENWKSTNHISRTRNIPLQFPGYRVRNGGAETTGKRATPTVVVNRGDTTLGVGAPAFWQNFPKTIEVTDSELVLHLFPPQTLEPHELQGGEQKTHVFYLAVGKDTVSPEPLAWTRQPLAPVLDPAWVERTKAISYLSAPGDGEEPYQALVDAAITGPDTFEKKREVIDEYGWRHFGDIYGDHEAILHTEAGPNPRISHYNNQYDPIAGFAYQWLRRSDPKWHAMMDELAYHVRDIDLYNTDADKAAYNHGLFWHTYHYVDADTGTHRSYPKNGRIPPKNNRVPGGGPGSEQNYAHGLLLHYMLTGEHASREACVGMARWVIDMDDGEKTVFRWLSDEDTGVASASRSPDYQGPGRGSGNSVATLLDGFRLTDDRAFLEKAEQIIRRVIHPADDIQRMVGMIKDGKKYVDAENRWFYLMFLQSLGKYLDFKAERGELDDAYAHARASLLHYSRWMATNEYPYLSRPEILEYPTETWVAQDMRKCEVFQFAAMHAEGEERKVFAGKAEEYHRYVTDTLPAMPTKTLCRPVVLLLSFGWSRFWHRKNPAEQRPSPKNPVTQFPPKPAFVPQKVIAKKRAKMIAATMGLFGIASVISLVVYLIR
ncbi:RIFT barrel domain-containing protein [Zavarzinella formosa]|uniref:RIFT barrel domain-containing protein n=1 Tax=Zavarzinella formosa TaxID=360055 RepID=UPI001EE6820C|nr:hypothetical protein [Zavarzinella formosa]